MGGLAGKGRRAGRQRKARFQLRAPSSLHDELMAGSRVTRGLPMGELWVEVAVCLVSVGAACRSWHPQQCFVLHIHGSHARRKQKEEILAGGPATIDRIEMADFLAREATDARSVVSESRRLQVTPATHVSFPWYAALPSVPGKFSRHRS